MRFIELHEGITESDNPVTNAITRRILLQRSDLLSKHGPVAVMQAIDDVADFVGDVEEIGSSDVSGWIRQVEQSLAGMGENADMAGAAPLAPPTVQQWAAKVKSLYPDVQFIHQKMLNGETVAMSAKAGGKVGFYDPKRGINKTVPVGAPVLEAGQTWDDSKINAMANMPGPQPSIPSKRLEVGATIGYVPRVAGRPTDKIVKAEVLEIGGMIGRSAVRVKLLDPQDIADNGGKLTAIISQFQVRQNPYGGESVTEDWADDAFSELLLKRDARRMGMSVAQYKHYLEKQKQDQEHELNIGAEGRSELKRKADELAEIKREKLRQEKLHDEEVAFQRAETVQQREDEMKKIADQYKHELTVIDKEHRNNMEAIRTNNTFELDKLDKEYNDNQREREFKSGESDKEFRDRNKDRDFRAGESDKEFRDRNQDREFRAGESDKDYADRQREREHQQSMAGMDKDQPEEPSPRPRPQRPRPEARPRPEPAKPSKPEPQTWHTNQQVGSTAKDDEDDIEDVESRPFTPYTPRPSKPMALSAPKRESRFSEAGRYGSNNPDTMSPSNYDRYQQDQMDQGKRDFKRREHEHEWEQEKAYTKQLQAQDRGPWYIRIDGKIYRQGGQPKSFDWKKGANNYALAMIKNNPSLQGKVMLSKNSEDK